MPAYFLDSSAAVKLYVAEAGSLWVTGLTDPALDHELFVARVTLVEVAAALFRRVRTATLPLDDAARGIATLREHLRSTLRLVEVAPAVVELAINMAERHGLRGYDCIQLAAATSVNQERLAAGLASLTLVSADDELNDAALAEGLPVENPNKHP